LSVADPKYFFPTALATVLEYAVEVDPGRDVVELADAEEDEPEALVVAVADP
jgi:hypothetical protein